MSFQKYVNNNTNLEWEYAEAHHWSVTPGNIKAGKWWNVCSIKKRGLKKNVVILC